MKSAVVLCVLLVATAVSGLPTMGASSGLLRTSSGRAYSVPVVSQVSMPEVGSSAWDQMQQDSRYMALKYIADRLPYIDVKPALDKQALEKFITDAIMWRRMQYGTPSKPM